MSLVCSVNVNGVDPPRTRRAPPPGREKPSFLNLFDAFFT
jgi:hypothetical protein